MGGWLADNWFTILNAVGVVGGLFLTAFSLRSETKTRRIANLLTVTANHRDVWKEFLEYPKLARVLDRSADLAKRPVTHGEEVFVGQIILHINSVFYAIKDEKVINLEGLRRDIAQFLSLPVPKSVWEQTKILQNEDFVEFVEKCRNWK